MKRALLIYPRYPLTFWSYTFALKFIHKRAAFPPLGLLTVASMLPKDWILKLVDMNVEKLDESLLDQSDIVLISAMNVQIESALHVITQCKLRKIPIIAGGPLFTSRPDYFKEIDYLVLNEAEITLPEFLADFEAGKARHIYQTHEFADLSSTPLPDWSLIRQSYYATMNIQYSRGCPYDCEFCDITKLYGRKVRTKSRTQIIRELQAVHDTGWRNEIFFVDDNFIGHASKLKKEILPAILDWQSQYRLTHSFNTQVSIELADDPGLIRMMTAAGFDKVFIGIESPNDESLAECNKFKNQGRNLIDSVNALQRSGLEVSGGFIVGFDHDPVSIFDKQINFIQKSGIVTAMVGLLHALPGTKLYNRLLSEKRLVDQGSGDNTDFSLNYVPVMNKEELLLGYRRLMTKIYSPGMYYSRVKTFLKEYRQIKRKRNQLRFRSLIALVKSMLYIGIVSRARFQYWKLLTWTLFTRPRKIRNSITFSITGYHFRKMINRHIRQLESM